MEPTVRIQVVVDLDQEVTVQPPGDVVPLPTHQSEDRTAVPALE